MLGLLGALCVALAFVVLPREARSRIIARAFPVAFVLALALVAGWYVGTAMLRVAERSREAYAHGPADCQRAACEGYGCGPRPVDADGRPLPKDRVPRD